MDASAIKEIQESITAAIVSSAIQKGHQGIALPSDYKLHDLEKFGAQRRRQRGRMFTPDLTNFAAHTATHASAEGAIIFADKFGATAVLNFGNPNQPGHADDLAIFAPDNSAEYLAFQAALQARHDQRSLCEFVEDWQSNLQIFGDSEAFTPGQALASLRKLTIEAIRSSETQVKQLSEQRSALEQISATSGKEGKLPTHFYFKCRPARHLPEREFRMRLSISTQDTKPTLRLHLIQGELHAEEMRQENIAAITAACAQTGAASIPVVSGSYSASA